MLSSINLSQHRGLFLHATTPKAKSALAAQLKLHHRGRAWSGCWRGAQSGVSVVRDVMLAQQQMEPNRCVLAGVGRPALTLSSRRAVAASVRKVFCPLPFWLVRF